MGVSTQRHGDHQLDQTDQSCVIMKFLVALSALVACAVAEAEPQYLGYGGYGLGYAGYGYAGLKSAPCVNAANVPVPCTYGKRDADADAYLGYAGYAGLGYAGHGYAGLGYAGLKSAPCVNAANIPVPCTYGKREAEAEPQYLGYAGYAGY